jgi:hypothetical protein
LFALLGSAFIAEGASAQIVTVQAATGANQVSAGDAYYGTVVQSQSDNNYDVESSESAAGPGSVATINTDAASSSVRAIANSTGLGAGYTTAAGASSGLIYYYQVFGGTGPVPVDISYFLQVATTGFGTANAEVVTYGFDPQTNQYSNVQGDTLNLTYQDSSQSKYGTFMTIATPGKDDELIMDARSSTSSDYSFDSASAEAYIDPYIFIDPTYLAANPGLTLQVSQGVGNSAEVASSTVPEPASWAMFVGGFGVMGAALRRRRVSRDRRQPRFGA